MGSPPPSEGGVKKFVSQQGKVDRLSHPPFSRGGIEGVSGLNQRLKRSPSDRPVVPLKMGGPVPGPDQFFHTFPPERGFAWE